MISPFPVYKTYEPNDRQRLFHAVGNAPGSSVVIKGAIGGLGGGKSTACEQELALLALKTPGAKTIACRVSMNRSDFSLIDDFKRILMGVATWRSAIKAFVFDNGHQMIVCPADEWDRFGSVQIAGFYLQEAQEMDHAIFKTLRQRLRDPLGVVGGIPYYTGLFDARGVKREHWIYKEFVQKAWNIDTPKEDRAKASNPDFVYCKFTTYDNRAVLDAQSPGYIENQERDFKHDIAGRKMFLEGEFGFDIEGRPVFECFNSDVHVAKIEADPSLPILRGWDFGYNRPAVTWSQYDRQGRFLVLRELCPTGVGREELCTMVESEQAIAFPDRHRSQYRDFGDIAGDHDNSASQQSDIDFVERYFGTSIDYRAGLIKPGLEIMRGLMMRTTKKGQPRFAVDVSCERLIDALQGGYYYRMDKTDERPVKGNGYDDVVDSVRYAVQLTVEESFVDGIRSNYDGWKSAAFAHY